MGEYITFMCSRPRDFTEVDCIEHVIVQAKTREFAKRHVSRILGGDPDSYIVTPLTRPGSRTIFMIEGTR